MLLVATGGAAAPVMMGVATVAGVASGLAYVDIGIESNEEMQKYFKDLFEVLSKDIDFSRQFEEELEDLTLEDGEDLEFEFSLKSGFGRYTGKGVEKLKQMAEEFLPSLDRVHVPNRGARKLLTQLLTAIKILKKSSKEGKKEDTKEDSFGEKAKKYAKGFAEGLAGKTPVFTKGAEEVAKETFKNTAKIAGGIAIGLGGLCLVLDVYKIYKDCNADGSTTNIFDELADAISYSRTKIEDEAKREEIEAELKNVAEEVKTNVAELSSKALEYFDTQINVSGLKIKDETEMKQNSMTLALEYVDTKSESREH